MRCKEQGIEGEIYKIRVKNIYRKKLTTNECYYCIKSDEERKKIEEFNCKKCCLKEKGFTGSERRMREYEKMKYSDKEYYDYWGIYINEKIVKKDYLIEYKENNEESIEIIINNKESNGYQSNKEELKEEKCKCEYKPTRNYKTLCMKHKHEVDGKDNSGFINCRNNILGESKVVGESQMEEEESTKIILEEKYTSPEAVVDMRKQVKESKIKITEKIVEEVKVKSEVIESIKVIKKREVEDNESEVSSSRVNLTEGSTIPLEKLI
ncbi:unnamed protein product [Rhizophagus irregularis]|nr:unnamed protein product [Rhizophagus irregularis]